MIGDRTAAQSSVVGVALLLGATVIALGVLTAGIGALVDGHVARTDAQRVAADLDEALRPVETTGHHAGRVGFAEGSLTTAERDLRLYDGGGLVAERSVDALVFERGERRVAFVAGAVVRGRGEAAWLAAEPPIVADANVLVVGAPILGASREGIGGSSVTARIETNVTHERRRFPIDTYRVAVETAAPAALEPHFERQGATVRRADIDGDGVPSVIASYPGSRTAFLVDHRMRLEVGHA